MDALAILEKPLAAAEQITLRLATPADNPHLAAVIRSVLPEFGALGPGYAIADPEVDCMFETYQAPRSRYFVAERAGRAVGGGGIAPLKGGEADVCKLQKFYLLPEARGQGIGGRLVEACLATAREFGFRRCYIETLPHMSAALTLYRRHGFQPLPGPMGATGHYRCEVWMVTEL